MRAARVIPLTGMVMLLGPYPLVGAQDPRLREDRLRAAVQAFTEGRATCAIVVLEPTPTDERMAVRPSTDITPAVRTLEPGCVPSHVIPAPRAPGPRASATPSASPIAAPPFAVPFGRTGESPAHPLVNGLADAMAGQRQAGSGRPTPSAPGS